MDVVILVHLLTFQTKNSKINFLGCFTPTMTWPDYTGCEQ